jgi:hypothetical protein
MVIRGKIRGNGGQLAGYLMKQADNDNVRVFDIRGTSQPNDLKASLLEMSLTAELTMSSRGLYHAQLNPAYGEDKKMQAADWFKAADMLEKELKYEGQKRVIVLHQKKGRTHAHVVWERYNHEKGIMISDSFSRLAQDRARKDMENELNHKKTPHRNAKRPEMKKVLTEVWQKTKSGAEFMKASVQKGYVIAKGEMRRPFMVIDNTGRSFDLTRQLKGVKSKEVRDRLKNEKLQSEKEAIAAVRRKNDEKVALAASLEKQAKQKPGHWVNRYEQAKTDAIKEHYETEKERMIRELKEQIEEQREISRQHNRGR